MATLDEILAAYGAGPGTMRTPGQEFYQFAQAMAPGPARQAFYSQEAPLTTRFQLAEPTYGGTFANWLSGYGGGDVGGFVPQFTYPTSTATNLRVDPLTGEQLRTRAQGIAGIAGLTGPQLASYYEGGPGMNAAALDLSDPVYAAMEGLTPNQLSAYRKLYGTGTDVGTNVQDLVKLLALQRPAAAGGEYQRGGAVGGAISSLIDELFSAYAGAQPAASASSFLDWYLERSKPGVAGTEETAAVAPGRLAFGG